MRVLFVVPGSVDSASARYRCVHFAEVLTYAGHSANVVSATETTAIVVEHDVVVLHRVGFSGTGQRLIAAARAIGAAVVYGADDLLFEPEYAYQVGLAHPDDPARYHYHRAEGKEARKCLVACDAALVSTEFLAARTRHALTNPENGEAKPVFVLRNFLGHEIRAHSWEAVKRRGEGLSVAGHESITGDRLTLGYLSGSPTHDADLADITPALAAVLSRSRGTRLLLVGPAAMPKALASALDAGQIQRHPFVPWRDLPGLLAGIDINLAPLDTSRVFNHAKSEVKFLEAAAVGVPTIAGTGLGFAEAVQDGENCLLVRRHADWEDALWGLVTDASERKRLAQAAFASVSDPKIAASATVATLDVFAALADFGRIGQRPSVTVRQPAAEQIERRFRKIEEGFLRRCFRIVRHLRLLRGES